MFNLGYEALLDRVYTNCDISGNIIKYQGYNPLYSSLFKNVKVDLNHISLNQQYRVNHLRQIVDAHQNIIEKDIFIKHSPLLDPIHFLIGKYQKDISKTAILPSITNGLECLPKVCDVNNASYIDNFFNYLSSQMLHNHDITNCIDYFGSNVVIEREFKYNVYDDIEYLEDSEQFLKTNNIYYHMETLPSNKIVSKNTQSNRPAIHIENENALMLDIIDDYDEESQLDSKHETVERLRFLFLTNSGEYGPESWGYMVLPTDKGCYFLDSRIRYKSELHLG